ncbi:MAG: S-layer homology domain-containing protein [Candidatus Peribacteraceae bacterium]|jgi:hypothetical protein|nr:S-layer homology domain-containing protein [Candidatus Peribacteraceae bacterium]MDP7646221.1 S-layer homology domain-containing protein [Candidatus Peribacteraceae bacterium]|tara:strand:- start:6 stop:836 length:831 start_codon:yes stop_codon:yes gene_type:complete
MSRLKVITVLAIILVPSITIAGVLEDLVELKYLEPDLNYISNQNAILKEESEMEKSDEMFSASKEDLLKSAAPSKDGFVKFGERGKQIELKDVPWSAWFAEAVQEVAGKGIISGYKNADGTPKEEFGPSDPVTIEQLAKIAFSASGDFGKLKCSDELKNNSVKSSWSEPYIKCAESEGWAIYSDGTIDVRRPATRTEVVVTLLQAFDVRLKEPSGTKFTDVPATMEFASAVETAAKNGVVSGYNNTEGDPTGKFGPWDPVNRASMAKMVSVALKVY